MLNVETLGLGLLLSLWVWYWRRASQRFQPPSVLAPKVLLIDNTDHQWDPETLVFDDYKVILMRRVDSDEEQTQYIATHPIIYELTDPAVRIAIARELKPTYLVLSRSSEAHAVMKALTGKVDCVIVENLPELRSVLDLQTS